MTTFDLTDIGTDPQARRLMALLERRIARLQGRGEVLAEARARSRLARLVWTSSPSAALGHLHRALALHREAGDGLACADALLMTADLLCSLGKGQDAQEMLDEARRLYAAGRDVAGLALTELVQAELCELPKARLDHLHRALQGFVALGHPAMAAEIWVRLALLHRAMGSQRPSEVALDSAAICFEVGGAPGEAARLCGVLTLLARGRGDLDEAEARVSKGLALAKEAGDDGLRAALASERGFVRLQRGAHKEALKALRQAQKLLSALETPLPAWEAEVLLAIGRLLASKMSSPHRNGELEIMIGKAVDNFIATGQPLRVVEASRALVELGQRTGDLALSKRWVLRGTEAAQHLDPEKTH